MPVRRKAILPGLILIFTFTFSFLIPGLIWSPYVSAADTKPSVTTGTYDVSGTDVEVKGTVTNDGGDEITAYGFKYGTTESCTSTKKVGSSIDEDEDFSEDLTDLIEGKKYYYRAYATNSEGTGYGSVKSFTTDDSDEDAPEVTTNSATGIGDDSAVLNAEIEDVGGSDIEEYGFYYGTTNSCTSKKKVGTEELDDGDEFDYSLGDLDEDKIYYFKAYAINDDGTNYGSVKSFTTDEKDEDAPEVTTNSATDIEDDSATLNAEIEDVGESDIEEYGFYYGTTSSCTTKKRVGTDELDEGDDFEYELDDLDEDETYYFKAYAINDDGTDYGAVKSFTMDEDADDDGKPSVTTKTTATAEDYATLYGVVTDAGDSDIESYGFYWGTSSSPSTKVEVDDDEIDEDDTFSYKVEDLNPGTTYYVKAYATNDDGTGYGSILSFKAKESSELATLTTKVSDIATTGATLTGAVTATGGGTVSEYGFVWGKSGGTESKIKVGSSIAVNTKYVYFLGGLQNGGSYYAKSYAVTGAGTAYGSKVEFTTSGSGTTTPVTPVTPVSGAPVVVISSPAPSSSVTRGTALSIYASASDDVGIQAMGLYVNGVQKIRPSGSALAYSLDTSSLPLGTCTIRVTAWDGSKVGEQAIIINIQSGSASAGTAPVVNIQNPSNGYREFAGTSVEISATATSSKEVQAMALYINGVKKMRCGGAFFNYYFNTKGMSPGTYTIQINAWDGTQSGEKTITFTIQ